MPRGRKPAASSWRPTPSEPGRARLVLVASGSSARQTQATNNRPVDAVIMAIVDTWEVGRETKYKK